MWPEVRAARQKITKQMHDLWREGLDDDEIAEAVGVTHKRVVSWRSSHSLTRPTDRAEATRIKATVKIGSVVTGVSSIGVPVTGTLIKIFEVPTSHKLLAVVQDETGYRHMFDVEEKSGKGKTRARKV